MKFPHRRHLSLLFSLGLLSLPFSLFAKQAPFVHHIDVICPKLPAEAALKDILFYNGEEQVIMDARGGLSYPNRPALAKIFDGNPETVLSGTTTTPFETNIDVMFGKQMSHVLIHSQTSAQLDGFEIHLKDIRHRIIKRIALGELHAAGTGPIYRIELNGAEIQSSAIIPENTQYAPYSLIENSNPDDILFDLNRASDRKTIQLTGAWKHTAEGLLPASTGLSSSNGKSVVKTIGSTIDGNPSTTWSYVMTKPLEWVYRHVTPTIVTHYSLTSAPQMEKCDPRSWRLMGSSDGKNWILLDDRKNEPAFTNRSETKTFHFENKEAFSDYRIVFTANQGDHYFHISEIQIGGLAMSNEDAEDQVLQLTQHTLQPGTSLLIELKHEHSTPQTQCRIQLGSHTFTIEDAAVLTDPEGNKFDILRAQGSAPRNYQILFSRGSGAQKYTLFWRIIGLYHDSQNQFVLPNNTADELSIQFLNSAKKAFKNKPLISRLLITRTPDSFPAMAKASRVPEMNIVGAPTKMSQIRRSGAVDLPPIRLQSAYGPLTTAELDLFKRAARIYPAPTTNHGNRLTFGGQQSTRGLFHVLEATKDAELLQIMERWCSSVYDYRNGGPNYQVNFMSPGVLNPGQQPEQAYPVWPNFGKFTYVNGVKHYYSDIAAAGSGPSLLLFYAEYITHNPELWHTPCEDLPNITRLERARQYIKQAESSIIDFALKYFADPHTGHIERPYNRYAQTIEACIQLENIYLCMINDPTIYNANNHARVNQVVRGYTEYFFDPEQTYQEWFIQRQGKIYPVMDFRYAPIHNKWGAYSEGLHYSAVDFAALIDVFKSGRYDDILTPARLLKIANTLRYLSYKGHSEDGKLLLSYHIRGDYVGQSKTWSHNHMLASFIDSSFYDDFVGDILAKQDGIAGFGGLFAIRETLAKLGHKAPDQRTQPAVKILDKGITGKGPYQIHLAASSVDHTLTYDWFWDDDATIDAEGPTIKRQVFEPGNYFFILRTTNSAGKQSFAQYSIDVNYLGLGQGTGYAGCARLHDLKNDNRNGGRLMTLGRLAIENDSGDCASRQAMGYLHPARNGTYRFFVSGDESCELFLSTTDDSADETRIAWTTKPTLRDEWYRYPEQQSVEIKLEAGKRYAFRFVHQSEHQLQHSEVAWQHAGMPAPEIIGGAYLSPDEAFEFPYTLKDSCR